MWETALNFVIIVLVGIATGVFIRKGNSIKNIITSVEGLVAEKFGGQEKWNNIKEAVLHAIAAVEETSRNESLTSEQKEELAIALAQDFLDVLGFEDVNSENLRYVIRAEGWLSGIFGKKEENDGGLKNS